MAARSTHQILTIKDEFTFIFLNFVITGLCNSSANLLSEIFSFLIPPPNVFYQTFYEPLKQVGFDIHHILHF